MTAPDIFSAAMRWAVGCLCVGLIHLLGIRTGLATEDGWKDGCPTFLPKESLPNYISGVPSNQGSDSFGVLPEVDSPLGSTRVAWEGGVGQLRQQPSPDGMPDYIAAGQALFQWNLQSGQSGPMFALRTSGAEAFGGSDGDHYHQAGDLQAFVGYRTTDYLEGPLARVGAAFRLGGGGSLFASNEQALIDQRERVAALAAFHTPLFGFDRPIILTFEARIELVGCHAPFLDFRIDGATWQTQIAGASTRVYDLPIEVAGGGYFLANWAAYVAVGVELRSPESTLLYSYLVRTNGGVEWQLLDDHSLRLSIHAGGIMGGNVTGFDAGMAVSLGFSP